MDKIILSYCENILFEHNFYSIDVYNWFENQTITPQLKDKIKLYVSNNDIELRTKTLFMKILES